MDFDRMIRKSPAYGQPDSKNEAAISSALYKSKYNSASPPAFGWEAIAKRGLEK
jgi:hypothetical protein